MHPGGLDTKARNTPQVLVFIIEEQHVSNSVNLKRKI